MSASVSKILRRLVLFCVATSLLTVGLGNAHAARRASAQQSVDRAAVLQAFFDALNSGNAAAAAATFNDNAILVRAPAAGACTRQSPCVGRPALLANLQGLVANHQCFTVLDMDVSGTVVTAHTEVRNDSGRATGVERQLVTVVALVLQYKQDAQYHLPDTTDPLTAASFAIAAGTQAPGPAITTVPPCV